jgi:ketosteroid isomerase-like protein
MARATSSVSLTILIFMTVADCVAWAQQPAAAATKGAIERARADIWAKELAIYAARGRGDLDTYMRSASNKFLGWPPIWPKPAGLEQMRKDASRMKTQTQEQLTMTLEDFTLSGDTGIIYYSTHRTRLPSGETVDQQFDIIHVWVREAGQWKLLGASGRDKIKR